MTTLKLYPSSYEGPKLIEDTDLALGFMSSTYYRRWRHKELHSSLWYAIALYISQDLNMYSTSDTWDKIETKVLEATR